MEFKCLLCDTPMAWQEYYQASNGRLVELTPRWECPRCWFWYLPQIPMGIPKKYLQKSIKRMCLKCRRREIKGKQKYCGSC